MKIEYSSEKIGVFGGVNFLHQLFMNKNICRFFDKELGLRSAFYGYQYSQAITALCYTIYCGGTALEDLQQLRSQFAEHKEIQIPSPDTVARVCNELSVATQTENTSQGITHQFNYNEKLNKLLLKLCVHTDQLQSGVDYILDYDNQVQPNEKFDSRPTYKEVEGYQPAVGSIGRLPLFIEGRNGNTPARYKMDETLKLLFSNLKQHDITIECFRSDAAAYQKEVIRVVEKNCSHFIIRIQHSEDLSEAIADIPQADWQTITLNFKKLKVADCYYAPFGGKKMYRIVVQRRLREDLQADLITGQAYQYYCLITTYEDLSCTEVIEKYNQRGSSEKNFDILNNDFNWAHLPFSFLHQNTVFMLLSAMAAVLFEWIKQLLMSKEKLHNTAIRTKQFLYRFMLIPFKFIQHARQQIVRIFSPHVPALCSLVT